MFENIIAPPTIQKSFPEIIKVGMVISKKNELMDNM